MREMEQIVTSKAISVTSDLIRQFKYLVKMSCISLFQKQAPVCKKSQDIVAKMPFGQQIHNFFS